ncbi:MAG: ABC transporter permease [Candidatus Eisenbacteria bacterium]|jgi:ABC-type transport system involved in multi-copper enzyme maturation permease subunit|nr:ABC transporter permease [Candidatus Eisenbacteria bacterium]
MFREILRFELGYRLRQPLLYLFAALFFLMAFGAVSTDSVQVGGAIGNICRNSPYVILNLLGSLSGMGVVLVTLFVTSAVNRDHECEIQELFFSTPLRTRDYLAGRFLGALIPTALAVMTGSLGIVVASAMPWQDPERILPFTLTPYLQGLTVFVLPNLLFAGALFFSVATLSRKVLWAWVAMVAFFTGWGISLSFIGDLENQSVVALIDPLGLAPFNIATRYWTVADKNLRVISVTGPFLINRLLWTAVGTTIMVFTWARYRMTLAAGRSRGVRRSLSAALAHDPAGSAPIPSVCLCFDAKTRLQQAIHMVRDEVRTIFRGVPFIVLLGLGVMNLVSNMTSKRGGSEIYPVTRRMLQEIAGGYELFIFLVLALYGAHLVWRERKAKLAEVLDSYPVPDWMALLSKVAALVLVAATVMAVGMLTTMTFQVIKGYHAFELGLYLKGLFVVSLSEWVIVAILALTAHVITNSRNLGFLVMIMYFLSTEMLPEFGLTHRLYLFGKAPRAIYSDMNGYGPHGAALLWYRVYWAFLAAFLLIAARLLWVRGTDARWRGRVREAARRLTPVSGIAGVALLAGFIGTGVWIYYNTTVLNDFETEKRTERRAALYEQRYKRYEQVAQPRVTAVSIQADLFPEEPLVRIRGTLHAVNRTYQPIDTLHLLLHRELRINGLSLPPHIVTVDDREIGYRICALESPVVPGDSLEIGFDLAIQPRGFVNNDPNTEVVTNGTFFDNTECIPRLGYDRTRELTEPRDRKKHGLPPRPRRLPVDDPRGRERMDLGHDAEWIGFEAVISTAPDQFAIAPGYLQREWTADGRRYFHYRMDCPIVNLWAVLSGRYEVARDQWGDVAIEVYHHPRHGYNVGRMIEAVRKSLDYYTATYGPYQFRQVRVIEFPRYRSFAQSLPNTIPYSESAHFIDDLRDPENLDMLFFVTAHEMAHQWWGHQVCSGDVEGALFIIESVTQYSAFMVMEKDFGPDQMRKFLKYEMDRYLEGRGLEKIGEDPLVRVSDQPYLYYSKGGLALYALRAYIGEEALNGALRRFLQDWAYQKPPYTTARVLVDYLREATPEEYRYLIEDLFETITLYDNRAATARVEERSDGTYAVMLEVESHKFRADSLGLETEIPHADRIEIGVFGTATVKGKQEETTLHRAFHTVHSGADTLEIVVRERPTRAGIDPRNVLIDRVPGDNVIRVS